MKKSGLKRCPRSSNGALVSPYKAVNILLVGFYSTRIKKKKTFLQMSFWPLNGLENFMKAKI